MHRSAFENQLMDMLTENIVNALHPSNHVSLIYPEGHHNNEWLNFENDQDRKVQDGTKSVFGFLMLNSWEQGYTRELSTPLDFRQRMLLPLMDRGLDDNLHILGFYSWETSAKLTSKRAC